MAKKISELTKEDAVWISKLIKIHEALGNLLDIPMPNGKLLRDCTGTEMGEYGEWRKRMAKEFEELQK